MKSLLPLIFVGLGIFLVGLGILWPFVFPATRSWTEAKAQRMIELQNSAHQLLFLADRAKTRPKPGGPSPQEAQAKFNEAEAELDTLREEFEGIRDSPNTIGTYLRWAGIALVLIAGGATVVFSSD